MKSSEILREAARRVELRAEDSGCWAIVAASGADDGVSELSHLLRANLRAKRAHGYFLNVAPQLVLPEGYWWGFHDLGPRIIGLCLAAAIAESEGD